MCEKFVSAVCIILHYFAVFRRCKSKTIFIINAIFIKKVLELLFNYSQYAFFCGINLYNYVLLNYEA